MRDGVVLRAEILRPVGPGRFPHSSIARPMAPTPPSTTTPRSSVPSRAATPSSCKTSGGGIDPTGEFRPYEHEGKDGYDTIEWAARQPWSDGNIGTFGLSYPGAVQWLAAVESPPHLKAMVPAMTFSTPQNFFYSWGVWDLSWSYWIWANIAPDTRVKRNLPGPRTEEEARCELDAARVAHAGHVAAVGARRHA